MKEYIKVAITFIIEYGIMVYSFFRFSFNTLVEEGIAPFGYEEDIRQGAWRVYQKSNTPILYDNHVPSLIYLVLFCITSFLIFKLVYKSYQKSNKSQAKLNVFLYLCLLIGIDSFLFLLTFFVFFASVLVMPFNFLLYCMNIVISASALVYLMVVKKQSK